MGHWVRFVSRLLPFAVALMLAAATATGSFASAAGTRADYVERVEPICKAANTANAGVLQGVKDEVARGHLKQAAPAVLRAARGLERVIGRLAPVPRPPADSRRLTRWLGYAKNGDRLLWKMGRSLRAERKGSVQAMANELVREAKRANAVVVGFDFDYCRLNPARFV